MAKKLRIEFNRTFSRSHFLKLILEKNIGLKALELILLNLITKFYR